MTITRSPGFYYHPERMTQQYDWRKIYNREELIDKYKHWNFKELPDAYRFVDPENKVARYYKFDGNIIQIPCGGLNFQE